MVKINGTLMGETKINCMNKINVTNFWGCIHRGLMKDFGMYPYHYGSFQNFGHRFVTFYLPLYQ